MKKIIIVRNEEGLIYGVTYVDHKTESVFNASDLGKQYSGKSIVERCQKEGREAPEQKQEFARQSASKTGPPEEQIAAPETVLNKIGTELLEALLKPENTSAYVPNQLT